MSISHCPYCGALVDETTKFCQKCGIKMDQKEPLTHDYLYKKISPKSGIVALILGILFGPLGLHRFYVGKIGTGLLTLITAGFLGIWTLIDLILIRQNKFKDKKGRPLILSLKLSPIKNIILNLMKYT